MCGAGVQTQMSLIHFFPNDEINIHILRQNKNLKHFVCQFGLPSSSLVWIVHLPYALIRPPQWQKYMLNYKDQIFFWLQPYNSLENNVHFSILVCTDIFGELLTYVQFQYIISLNNSN